MFKVYAIYNKKNNKIYIGQTDNLDERLKSHNNKIFTNSYTSRFDGDWVLVFSEEQETRQDSLKREKQLKSYKGRESIWSIVKNKYSRVAQR